jgi:hypothetical protein
MHATLSQYSLSSPCDNRQTTSSSGTAAEWSDHPLTTVLAAMMSTLAKCRMWSHYVTWLPRLRTSSSVHVRCRTGHGANVFAVYCLLSCKNSGSLFVRFTLCKGTFETGPLRKGTAEEQQHSPTKPFLAQRPGTRVQ